MTIPCGVIVYEMLHAEQTLNKKNQLSGYSITSIEGPTKYYN